MSVILTAVSFSANNTVAVQSNYADNPQAYLTEWDTTTIPTIAGGKSFYIGGAAYLSSGTGAVGGTVPTTAGTYYLKFVISTLAIEWETATTSYDWDESNGGWYNGTTAMLVPVSIVYDGSSVWTKTNWLNIRSKGAGWVHETSYTDGELFDDLAETVPSVGSSRNGVIGTYIGASTTYSINRIYRASTTQILLYGADLTNDMVSSELITDGGTTSVQVSMSW